MFQFIKKLFKKPEEKKEVIIALENYFNEEKKPNESEAAYFGRMLKKEAKIRNERKKQRVDSSTNN